MSLITDIFIVIGVETRNRYHTYNNMLDYLQVVHRESDVVVIVIGDLKYAQPGQTAFKELKL